MGSFASRLGLVLTVLYLAIVSFSYVHSLSILAPAGLSYQSKRTSGMPAECRGRYDAAIYTQLENICEDCYNLYKEPDVHLMCRSDCFSSTYFKQCLEALLLAEEQYLNMAQIIGR